MNRDQGSGGYGQNIALWGVSSGAEELGATGAVKMATTNMWYDGEFNSFLPEYYGKATPDMINFESWGHLSQVVWADTKTVGCHAQFCPRGTAYSNLDSWFTVCNYQPPGMFTLLNNAYSNADDFHRKCWRCLCQEHQQAQG